MEKFKVGDWVRNIYVDHLVSKVQSINSEELVLENGCSHKLDDGCLELWQPKEGEWCWFNEEGNPCCPMLKQFERIDMNGYCTPVGMVRGFKSCEPFIGQLPSFLEEQQ